MCSCYFLLNDSNFLMIYRRKSFVKPSNSSQKRQLVPKCHKSKSIITSIVLFQFETKTSYVTYADITQQLFKERKCLIDCILNTKFRNVPTHILANSLFSIPFTVSPNRYYESDVNIHFKTPVRQEFKSPLSEEELAVRQAEQMQKLYQEERRRKYLQELQDMNSRRHTDNFTPSQKSPIALNRYDDFPADLAPKTLNQPKSVARALYNFQAQNSK